MPQSSPQSAEVLTQVHLDPQLTVDCAVAALAAYADLDKDPIVAPKGFEFVARFTGWDEIFVTGEEERFGLIFKSLTESGTYLVAFRGTYSILDGYEDIWATTVAFKPYQPPKGFPKDVYVASGFDSIYVDKGGSMKAPMQTQVFTELAKLDPAPKKLLITGHSLGSALASLFALDAAASRPDLKLINLNFASPRVGKEKWQSVYDKQYSLEGATFRVVNYWDWVPSLPPEWILDYTHVGQQFLIAFYVKDAWYPHILSRHSMLNYQTVVDKAVIASPQVWVGEFADAVNKNWTMVSERPPSSEAPLWLDLVREMEQATRSGSCA